MSYEIGDKVKMTEDALDNYGEKYRDQALTVEHVAHSEQEHPGYDNSLLGQGLYDFQDIEFSLYDYELEDI